MILNEPETSLHPELIPALARLIADAASRTQVTVVTHNGVLIDALSHNLDTSVIELQKTLGETMIAGQRLLDRPRWEWPER